MFIKGLYKWPPWKQIHTCTTYRSSFVWVQREAIHTHHTDLPAATYPTWAFIVTRTARARFSHHSLSRQFKICQSNIMQKKQLKSLSSKCSPYEIPYNWKYWRWIKFGGLAIEAWTAKLSSTNIFKTWWSLHVRWADRQIKISPIFINAWFGA